MYTGCRWPWMNNSRVVPHSLASSLADVKGIQSEQIVRKAIPYSYVVSGLVFHFCFVWYDIDYLFFYVAYDLAVYGSLISSSRRLIAVPSIYGILSVYDDGLSDWQTDFWRAEQVPQKILGPWVLSGASENWEIAWGDLQYNLSSPTHSQQLSFSVQWWLC